MNRFNKTESAVFLYRRFSLYLKDPGFFFRLFKLSSKIFVTDRSKAVLLLWIICVIYVLCLS